MNEVLCFKNGSFYDSPGQEKITIQGEQFQKLMDLCFTYADWFSLRRCGSETITHEGECYECLF